MTWRIGTVSVLALLNLPLLLLHATPSLSLTQTSVPRRSMWKRRSAGRGPGQPQRCRQNAAPRARAAGRHGAPAQVVMAEVAVEAPVHTAWEGVVQEAAPQL